MLRTPFDFNTLKLLGFVGVCSLSLVGLANSQTGTTIAKSVTQSVTNFSQFFSGGSQSIVAKAVGSAEGTRTPDGGKTWAYYGHVDPGNGVRNMGSFAYQHSATSPEDADAKQLARLRSQSAVLVQQAKTHRITLDPFSYVAGIDLANQSPLAAMGEGGYVPRLRQCFDQGESGSEAVLCARTNSFRNPRTNAWDAPGLGNNLESIRRDQARRNAAIKSAMKKQ